MKKALAITILGGFGLSACDDSSNVATGISSLGQTFTRAFQQDPNDAPIQLDGVTLPRFPEREPFEV